MQSRRVKHRKSGGAAETDNVGKPLRKKVMRRRLSCIVHKLYHKNRSECAKRVLSDDWAKEPKDTPLEEQDSCSSRTGSYTFDFLNIMLSKL